MKEIISKKQLRDFGLVIGFGFPLLIGWFFPLLMGHGFRPWTILIGLPLFIIGLIAPHVLHYPFKIWMALGNFLGWVNSRIILGLVFVGVLLPIAFIMRLTGYDPLRIRKKGKKTFREERKNYKTDLTRIF